MRVFLIIVSLLILVIATVFYYQNKPNTTINPIPTPQTPVYSIQPVNITASFTIKTDNIIRNFSNPKYHNQSAEVFIEASDPTLVQVKKVGVTWQDFFNTLPMKLTKNCLTTGDGEIYCDKKDGSLKFYINAVEDKDALDREIKSGDKLFIEFLSS